MKEDDNCKKYVDLKMLHKKAQKKIIIYIMANRKVKRQI